MDVMSIASEKKVLVCTNSRSNPNQPSCAVRGSESVFTTLSEILKDKPISLEKSPCMGLCQVGPNVKLVPNGMFFNVVDTQKLTLIIEEIKAFTEC